MKIHEYQAKDLLSKYKIAIQPGMVTESADQATDIARRISPRGPWVVKAQVHAGGRGKAGGVKFCKTLEEVHEASKNILSKPLVTHQTGPKGVKVSKVLVVEAVDIAREIYCAMVLDRATSSVAIMASREGGVEIEEVAAKHPEKIFKVYVDPSMGIGTYQARTLAYDLELPKDLHASFASLIQSMAKLFIERDCSLVEINPLVITNKNELMALDAKITFDENALFRHPEIKEFFDPTQEDPIDLEAAKWNLNYIHLDGNIGCMVNGAGLAMATMDMIKMAGGEPANFLDVGGGASAEMVREAFKILTSDPKVKGIFVNIFGGIMRCDVLAKGIVDAVTLEGLKVPLVVRLEGTNVDEGRRILNESKLNIQATSNMGEAAKMIVEKVMGA